MTPERRTEVGQEYRLLHRNVAAAYRRVRDHYRRFLEDEPRYDVRLELYDDAWAFSIDQPLTKWWDDLTFDAALWTWANADDDHLRPFLEQQGAILDVFADWIAEPANHYLADDLAGARADDDEIVALLQRRQNQQQEVADAPGRRAHVTGAQGQVNGREYADQYTFRVLNAGPAVAREPRFWVAGSDGAAVTPELLLAAMAPGGEHQEIVMDIPRQQSDAGGLSLRASWTDDAGEQEEDLLEIRPLRR